VDTATIPVKPEAKPLLAVHQITKKFGGLHVLRQVDFTLFLHEVHALVGANGAGKTTLMRTIAGLYKPDGGTIFVDGREIVFSSPRDAMQAGIAMVTQETSLAAHLSVLENIFLPRLCQRGRLDWRNLRQLAHQLIETLQIDVQFGLDQELGRLSIANRQIVEILKMLALEPKIIFLDEPTTSLSPYESNRLFELMAKMAANGHGIVLVSHRMEEIFAASQRLSVLREGHLVAHHVETASLDAQGLVKLMVGKPLQKNPAPREESKILSSHPLLRVENLQAGTLVCDVSFDVKEGEIVGLAGLVGAGRSETAEIIFGMRPCERGKMTWMEKDFMPHSPACAIRAGLGFVGEDRRAHGLVPDMSVHENLLLVQLGLQKQGRLAYHDHARHVMALLQQLGIDGARLGDDIMTFSGGMQQKIIIARWLLAQPKLLILDEPTRGVDIETRTTLYKTFHQLADAGVGLLVISSDFEELLDLAHRIVVLNDGRSIANVARAQLTAERLTMLSTPRSSASSISRLLHFLTQVYQAAALWFDRDGEDIFCFDVTATPGLATVLPPKGTFSSLSQSALAEHGTLAKRCVTLRGKQGQTMGCIALLGQDERKLPSCEGLERTLHEWPYLKGKEANT